MCEALLDESEFNAGDEEEGRGTRSGDLRAGRSLKCSSTLNFVSRASLNVVSSTLGLPRCREGITCSCGDDVDCKRRRECRILSAGTPCNA